MTPATLTQEQHPEAHKIDAAAKRLDMSKRSLERHIALGRIRVVRIGRSVRVPESEIRRVLSAME